MRPSLVLGSLLAALAACRPAVSDVVYKTVPPRPADCKLTFVTNMMRDGKAGAYVQSHENLGVIVTSKKTLTPELTREVSRRACAMGGDTINHEDPLLIDGKPETELSFLVMRAYTPEELEVREAALLLQIGVTDAALVEKVAYDLDCPAASIKVLKKRDDVSSGDYLLDVCGAERAYVRTGTVYRAADAPTPAPAPASAP